MGEGFLKIFVDRLLTTLTGVEKPLTTVDHLLFGVDKPLTIVDRLLAGGNNSANKRSGEVIRARHMSQNSSKIATKTLQWTSPHFLLSQAPIEPPEDGACIPDLKLIGDSMWEDSFNHGARRRFDRAIHTFESHKDVGNQATWRNEAIFVSSSNNTINAPGLVADVQNKIKDDPHDGHTNSVSELSWNPNKDWVIASVAADSMIQIWQIAESIYRSEYNTLHSQPTPAQCSFNFF
ncbi:hypothetical protein Pint_06718 [Pistacia integerrima]|uniref:Uncharacterized protein n=1 Tax=Pistacia integerrima TaxID=434235 RepID=A0ACC0XVM3_9ROSI|nr:hypothetical protein Pint_06718 [Pistacia integerrima]